MASSSVPVFLATGNLSDHFLLGNNKAEDSNQEIELGDISDDGDKSVNTGAKNMREKEKIRVKLKLI